MSDVTIPEPPQPAGTKPDRLRLFEIASEQGGYFAAEQARESGYSFALLSHHFKSSRFIRIRRGLYRLREYPSFPREEVLAAWLAAGKDVSIVSHESALDLLDLSDVIPDAVHVTVPRTRRSLSAPPGVNIHTTERPLRPVNRTVRDGMAITSAARTILDAVEAGTAPEQIEMAVVQAVERGMVLPSQLRRDAAERGRRVATLIEGALSKAAA